MEMEIKMQPGSSSLEKLMPTPSIKLFLVRRMLKAWYKRYNLQSPNMSICAQIEAYERLWAFSKFRVLMCNLATDFSQTDEYPKVGMRPYIFDVYESNIPRHVTLFVGETATNSQRVVRKAFLKWLSQHPELLVDYFSIGFSLNLLVWKK